MGNDLTLWDEGVSTLEAWEPNLQALVDGHGDTTTITAKQVQAVDDFLASLSTAGSSALQRTITDERDGLGTLDDFVGMTMREAQAATIDYTVYLPIIARR